MFILHFNIILYYFFKLKDDNKIISTWGKYRLQVQIHENKDILNHVKQTNGWVPSKVHERFEHDKNKLDIKK